MPAGFACDENGQGQYRHGCSNVLDIYFNRGNVFLTEGNFEKAHRDFDVAIDKERMNAKYYHAKGLAFQAEVEFLETQPDYSVEEVEEKVLLR